jgi:hypothetical protein
MVFVIVPLVSITVVVVWARGRSDAISADAARAG